MIFLRRAAQLSSGELRRIMRNVHVTFVRLSLPCNVGRLFGVLVGDVEGRQRNRAPGAGVVADYADGFDCLRIRASLVTERSPSFAEPAISSAGSLVFLERRGDH